MRFNLNAVTLKNQLKQSNINSSSSSAPSFVDNSLSYLNLNLVSSSSRVKYVKNNVSFSYFNKNNKLFLKDIITAKIKKMLYRPYRLVDRTSGFHLDGDDLTLNKLVRSRFNIKEFINPYLFTDRNKHLLKRCEKKVMRNLSTFYSRVRSADKLEWSESMTRAFYIRNYNPTFNANKRKLANIFLKSKSNDKNKNHWRIKRNMKNILHLLRYSDPTIYIKFWRLHRKGKIKKKLIRHASLKRKLERQLQRELKKQKLRNLTTKLNEKINKLQKGGKYKKVEKYIKIKEKENLNKIRISNNKNSLFKKIGKKVKLKRELPRKYNYRYKSILDRIFSRLNINYNHFITKKAIGVVAKLKKQIKTLHLIRRAKDPINLISEVRERLLIKKRGKKYLLYLLRARLLRIQQSLLASNSYDANLKTPTMAQYRKLYPHEHKNSRKALMNKNKNKKNSVGKPKIVLSEESYNENVNNLNIIHFRNNVRKLLLADNKHRDRIHRYLKWKSIQSNINRRLIQQRIYKKTNDKRFKNLKPIPDYKGKKAKFIPVGRTRFVERSVISYNRRWYRRKLYLLENIKQNTAKAIQYPFFDKILRRKKNFKLGSKLYNKLSSNAFFFKNYTLKEKVQTFSKDYTYLISNTRERLNSIRTNFSKKRFSLKLLKWKRFIVRPRFYKIKTVESSLQIVSPYDGFEYNPDAASSFPSADSKYAYSSSTSSPSTDNTITTLHKERKNKMLIFNRTYKKHKESGYKVFFTSPILRSLFKLRYYLYKSGKFHRFVSHSRKRRKTSVSSSLSPFIDKPFFKDKQQIRNVLKFERYISDLLNIQDNKKNKSSSSTSKFKSNFFSRYLSVNKKKNLLSKLLFNLKKDRLTIVQLKKRLSFLISLPKSKLKLKEKLKNKKQVFLKKRIIYLFKKRNAIYKSILLIKKYLSSINVSKSDLIKSYQSRLLLLNNKARIPSRHKPYIVNKIKNLKWERKFDSFLKRMRIYEKNTYKKLSKKARETRLKISSISPFHKKNVEFFLSLGKKNEAKRSNFVYLRPTMYNLTNSYSIKKVKKRKKVRKDKKINPNRGTLLRWSWWKTKKVEKYLRHPKATRRALLMKVTSFYRIRYSTTLNPILNLLNKYRLQLLFLQRQRKLIRKLKNKGLKASKLLKFIKLLNLKLNLKRSVIIKRLKVLLVLYKTVKRLMHKKIINRVKESTLNKDKRFYRSGQKKKNARIAIVPYKGLISLISANKELKNGASSLDDNLTKFIKKLDHRISPSRFASKSTYKNRQRKNNNLKFRKNIPFASSFSSASNKKSLNLSVSFLGQNLLNEKQNNLYSSSFYKFNKKSTKFVKRKTIFPRSYKIKLKRRAALSKNLLVNFNILLKNKNKNYNRSYYKIRLNNSIKAKLLSHRLQKNKSILQRINRKFYNRDKNKNNKLLPVRAEKINSAYLSKLILSFTKNLNDKKNIVLQKKEEKKEEEKAKSKSKSKSKSESKKGKYNLQTSKAIRKSVAKYKTPKLTRKENLKIFARGRLQRSLSKNKNFELLRKFKVRKEFLSNSVILRKMFLPLLSFEKQPERMGEIKVFSRVRFSKRVLLILKKIKTALQYVYHWRVIDKTPQLTYTFNFQRKSFSYHNRYYAFYNGDVFRDASKQYLGFLKKQREKEKFAFVNKTRDLDNPIYRSLRLKFKTKNIYPAEKSAIKTRIYNISKVNKRRFALRDEYSRFLKSNLNSIKVLKDKQKQKEKDQFSQLLQQKVKVPEDYFNIKRRKSTYPFYYYHFMKEYYGMTDVLKEPAVPDPDSYLANTKEVEESPRFNKKSYLKFDSNKEKEDFKKIKQPLKRGKIIIRLKTNNVFMCLVNKENKVVNKISGGLAGFNGKTRRMPFSKERVAYRMSTKAFSLNYKFVDIKFKNMRRRHHYQLAKGFAKGKLFIRFLDLQKQLPHGYIRAKKPRRM